MLVFCATVLWFRGRVAKPPATLVAALVPLLTPGPPPQKNGGWGTEAECFWCWAGWVRWTGSSILHHQRRFPEEGVEEVPEGGGGGGVVDGHTRRFSNPPSPLHSLLPSPPTLPREVLLVRASVVEGFFPLVPCPSLVSGETQARPLAPAVSARIIEQLSGALGVACKRKPWAHSFAIGTRL